MKKLTLILALLTLIILQSYAFAGSLGDPFDGNTLKNPNWKWQNEPNWDLGKTNNGWLHINTANNQNLWDVDTVAKLYQLVEADKIDIATHLVMDYKGTGSCVSGLVIKSPSDANWTTMKFWGRAGDAILQWQHKQAEVVGNVPGSSQPAGRVEVFIRIAKNGNEYTGYWKKNAKDDWIEITPHANKALKAPLEVGIFAGNCEGGGTMTAQFEYFEDLITPYASVDSSGKTATTWASLKAF
ncbi:TPA: hypothetical protein ENS27_11025 [bacterium]|nr:hypothetical protein [bacterium]